MSDLLAPIDNSQSDEALDEDLLEPLSKSPGALADDPMIETENAEYQGNHDPFELEPGEEPGQDTRPQDTVLAPDEEN